MRSFRYLLAFGVNMEVRIAYIDLTLSCLEGYDWGDRHFWNVVCCRREEGGIV